MIAQRILCPTSATWHDRHFVTDRRWRIVTLDDQETVLCSAACALSWLVYGLPAAIGQSTDAGDAAGTMLMGAGAAA